MPDILHRVGIKSSIDAVYKALTERTDLDAWWTTDIKGESEIGGALHFRLGDRGFFDMKVLEVSPIKLVAGG